jgi:hypothetical protein
VNLNVVCQFGDHGQPEALRPAGVGDLHLEPPGLVGQGDPDRLGRAVQPVRLDRARAGLPDGQPHLVKKCLIDATAPGHRGRDQPGRSHVGWQSGKADFNCRHVGVSASGYFSDFLAVIASSTVSWIPNTLVRPVIRKILRIRSCVQTRSSDPS